MSSKMNLVEIEYLKNEYTTLQNDPILSLGCTIGLMNNDIFHWKFSLMGPQDTPYEGGMFFLTADFPDDYPQGKPEVRFCNKIYHLNVSPSNGHMYITILNKWKPETPMANVISEIYAFFNKQNPDFPYSREMTREYEKNRSEFDRKAKEWTQKYASMND